MNAGRTLRALRLGAATSAAAALLAAPAYAQPSAFTGFAIGTSRLPGAMPMEGLHAMSGPWMLMAHGGLTLGHRWDPAPRGEPDAFFTNMIAGTARRTLGGGWLELAARGSLEPAMGRAGYSLLLQTGESADGVVPLLDRQHPHDALVELSASYGVQIDEGAWAFAYVAPVGSPALGPVPYMHRPSSASNPVAPITHHFLDATHVTHGVITLGMLSELVQLEASWFTGREPDEDRWVPEAPRLDSWSVRLTLTPGSSWAIQGSFGALHEPERLHAGVDIRRSTVSVTHHAGLGAGFTSSSTLAWGRNTTPRAVVEATPSMALLGHDGIVPAPWPSLEPQHHGMPDPGGAQVTIYPERARSALLAESALARGPATLFARYERARKDELFPVGHPAHSTPFTVGKLDAGVVGRVPWGGAVTLELGVSASLHWLPSALTPEYGTAPKSWMLFTRIGF